MNLRRLVTFAAGIAATGCSGPPMPPPSTTVLPPPSYGRADTPRTTPPPLSPWLQPIARTYPADKRHVVPNDSLISRAQCRRLEAHPESLVIAGTHYSVLGAQTWSSQASALPWTFVSLHPGRPDTLRVALRRALTCRFETHLVMEASGYVFSVDVSNDIGASVPDRTLRVPRADGRLDSLLLITIPPRDSVVAVGSTAERDSVSAMAERRRVAAIRAQRWRPEYTEAAIARKVVIGMNAEMVEAAWGSPQSINRTTTRSGTREQWVYGSGHYVYLDNGVVRAIQTRR